MVGLAGWLGRKFGAGHGEGLEAEEVRSLTSQFFVSLRAYLSAIEAQGQSTRENAIAQVTALANKSVETRTWRDAYDLEQQLVLLYDDQTLSTELSRRLVEARASLRPEVVRWYEDAVAKAETVPEQRTIMTRLVNDIQWRYTKAEARRGYTKQITKRTEIVFTASVLTFAIALVLIITLDLTLNHLSLMSFVGATGAFGATFSMMTSLKSRLAESSFDDLKLNRSWGLILARVLVGIGASFVLYFFVASNLLAGQAFPSLGEMTNGSGSGADVNFAKLFIWSFLSGFSEKLIPNLLSQTQDQGGELDQLPPQSKGSIQSATFASTAHETRDRNLPPTESASEAGKST